MNEYNIFKWNQNFWMNLKFLNEIIEIKQHETERKSKLYNDLIIIELKTYYWKNMSLLQKHPVIEYKIEIFE